MYYSTRIIPCRNPYCNKKVKVPFDFEESVPCESCGNRFQEWVMHGKYPDDSLETFDVFA